MIEEIYLSTDVEADGPIPGPHSMLSFASAAFSCDLNLVDTFEANLETLPEAEGHPDTMSWWDSQQEAWKECRQNLIQPSEAMTLYVTWIKQLPGKPIFVGYPVSYDFMFVYWYLIRFTGESPFSHSALDIKTLAMSCLRRPYSSSTKRNMPKHWFDKESKHTHKALDDAVEQGELFCNIMREIRET